MFCPVLSCPVPRSHICVHLRTFTNFVSMKGLGSKKKCLMVSQHHRSNLGHPSKCGIPLVTWFILDRLRVSQTFLLWGKGEKDSARWMHCLCLASLVLKNVPTLDLRVKPAAPFASLLDLFDHLIFPVLPHGSPALRFLPFRLFLSSASPSVPTHPFVWFRRVGEHKTAGCLLTQLCMCACIQRRTRDFHA